MGIISVHKIWQNTAHTFILYMLIIHVQLIGTVVKIKSTVLPDGSFYGICKFVVYLVPFHPYFWNTIKH